MSAQASHDVVIVGAGHNGLVCAFYLARAGLKVKLVERRAVVSLLHHKVIAELELHRHGLEILERPGGSLAPLGAGRCLSLPREDARAVAEIAKFSGPR